MTSLIPCSTSNIYLTLGAASTIKKHNHLRRSILERNSVKHTSSSRLILPLPASVRLLPQYRRDFTLLQRSKAHTVSATGTDVSVEESDSPIIDKDSGGSSEIPGDKKSSVKSEAGAVPAQSRRSRVSRKSEMPPVKNVDLVPGATFTGKVRSIQPFGAFVDFGAFTDGLVHVSRLSDSFVKDVGSIVSIGQEVKVRLVEVNIETGRISLSMRENDDASKDASATSSSNKLRPAQRKTSMSSQRKEEIKSSKFVKGQELKGTVKKLTRSGTVISLPEGEEGFLPTSEESDDGWGSMMGTSSLEVGQEVRVCVLHITRGQVTLTMKTEENNEEPDVELSRGVVHVGTNPFVLAFRQNKDIAAFLDEREKLQKAEKKPLLPKTSGERGQVNQSEAVSYVLEVEDQVSSIETTSMEVSLGANDNKETQSVESSSLQSLEDAVQIEKEAEEISRTLDPEGNNVDQITEEVPSIDEAESDGKSGSVVEIASQILSSESVVGEGVLKSELDVAFEKDAVEIQAPISETKISTSEPLQRVAETPGENGSIEGVQLDIPYSQKAQDGVETVEDSDPSGDSSESPILASESNVTEEVGVGSNKDEIQIETPALEPGIPSASEVEGEKVETTSEKSVDNTTESPILASESIKAEAQIQIPPTEPEIPSFSVVQGKKVVTTSVNCVDNSDDVPVISSESQSSELLARQVESIKEEEKIEMPDIMVEVPSVSQAQDVKVETAQGKNGNVNISNGQSGSPSPKESVTKATISPALVKQLREETGAGMMDCKKALAETGGDIVKAQEFLRKKGLASAEKKASRATAEGRIGSYIHDSRIGVLVEVNCETDFVARGDIFKDLVEDLAMQVAACPQVQYLITEDVPEELVNKEQEIEMQKEDLMSKPEQIRAKIVEGRIRKRLEELALLEQPYIKNDRLVVKDWVRQTIATIGENIKVKRFVRYNLGEGLEKKSQDFAAEVAAQTAAKSTSAPAKEQPAATEFKETAQKPPAVTVSATLVKQLREETGAGMMDCKKALSETGGDLEKAQEYLRKKGLSTADKKSSRLAAEGRIGSYIHDSRIGVLIEVNCETDFVGRSEKFKELVDDLAMQVVACPQVLFVSIEDIPESIRNKEKELEMQREDLASKPENIRERIVEGRVFKRLGELALLEQPFIKNGDLLVKDLVKQTVAALGENIKVRRFVKFTLGESTEKA